MINVVLYNKQKQNMVTYYKTKYTYDSHYFSALDNLLFFFCHKKLEMYS